MKIVTIPADQPRRVTVGDVPIGTVFTHGYPNGQEPTVYMRVTSGYVDLGKGYFYGNGDLFMLSFYREFPDATLNTGPIKST